MYERCLRTHASKVEPKLVDREDLGCVLIDPPAATANIYQNCNVKRALEHHAVYPPIGLAYIAAVLRESGINVKIIDARSLGLSYEDVVKAVGDEKVDFVGITVLTSQLKSALDLSRKIKSAYPHAVLVLGGAHIHFQHREVIEKDYVDFCVRGEGEYTMTELVHAVSNADDLRQVKGITFKEGNKVIVTAERPLIQNLDNLPFPARDLLPNHIYRRYVMGEEEKFTAILASRGCPFRCHFCAVPAMWKKHRRRSVESVLDEFEHVHERYTIDNVRFSDDLFVANKKWVFEFCKKILDRGLDIKWSCDGRIGLMSMELLRQMKKAGCQHIFYGIEFGDQRILNFSGKGITIEQTYDTVKHTKEAGIIPYGYFMIGYPTETKETIEKTISLATDPNLGMDHAGFSIVTPFPGTQLYEYCKANGLLKTTDWNQYSMIQPGKGVIKLRNVTDEEVVNLYYKAHREFYFRHVREGLRQEFRDWGLVKEEVATAHRTKLAT